MSLNRSRDVHTISPDRNADGDKHPVLPALFWALRLVLSTQPPDYRLNLKHEILQSSGSQLGVILLSSRGHLAISGDTFGCDVLWKRHLVGRGQGFCSTSYNVQVTPLQRIIQPKMLTVQRLRSPAPTLSEDRLTSQMYRSSSATRECRHKEFSVFILQFYLI